MGSRGMAVISHCKCAGPSPKKGSDTRHLKYGYWWGLLHITRGKRLLSFSLPPHSTFLALHSHLSSSSQEIKKKASIFNAKTPCQRCCHSGKEVQLILFCHRASGYLQQQPFDRPTECDIQSSFSPGRLKQGGGISQQPCGKLIFSAWKTQSTF